MGNIPITIKLNNKMEKIVISVTHNGNLIGVYQTPEKLIIETTGSVTLANPNPSSKITIKIK